MPLIIPTNNLAIYLIKDDCGTPEKIIDEYEHVHQQPIDTNAVLYYKSSGRDMPKWVNKFFGEAAVNSLRDDLFSAYVSAVLLVKVPIGDQVKIFAIPFGLGGWHMLAAGCFEERFGLMCTLNLVSPNTLRSIEKSNLGLAPKQSQEQVSKEGEIADFGIDIEQDLIRSVTGKCKNKDVGGTVTGKDSLHVSVKADMSNIRSMLKDYYHAYESDDYKEDFGWVDHVAEVKDPVLIESLHTILESQLADHSNQKIWLAVPDVIEWSDVQGFGYQHDRGDLYDDLFLREMRKSFDNAGLGLTVENLKQCKAYAVSRSNGHRINSWRLYNCLYAEVTDAENQKLYMLSNGKWYDINTDFVSEVNRNFSEAVIDPVVTTTYAIDESEEDYNKRAARENNLVCMDRELVPHGGGRSKIEFCDLYDPANKKIIHVKKYGGSSVLSHLFSQGLVSGEVMLSDSDFRKRLNDKLPESAKFSRPEDKPRASDYTIVYGVMSATSSELDIPFFSKVSLSHAKRRLELIGYKVGVQKISLS